MYAYAQSEHRKLIKFLIKVFRREFRFIQIFRSRLAFPLDLAELWILEVEFGAQLRAAHFDRLSSDQRIFLFDRKKSMNVPSYKI